MRVLPLPDDVWNAIEILLPDDIREPTIAHRRVIEGIVYSLRHNIALCDLPVKGSCGSPRTISRRIERWRQNGCWSAIVATLRSTLPDGRTLPWDRVAPAVGPTRSEQRTAGVLTL